MQPTPPTTQFAALLAIALAPTTWWRPPLGKTGRGWCFLFWGLGRGWLGYGFIFCIRFFSWILVSLRSSVGKDAFPIESLTTQVH